MVDISLDDASLRKWVAALRHCEDNNACLKTVFPSWTNQWPWQTVGQWLQANKIEDWDVSKVTNMEGLFAGDTKFTGFGICHWDVSSVRTMATMFAGCSSFTNMGIGRWDVSNVETMQGMFLGCVLFEVGINPTPSPIVHGLGLYNWNVSKVTNMNYLFYGCKNLRIGAVHGLDRWDVSKVETMSHMFFGCDKLESQVFPRRWNVSNVTNMTSMFEGCTRFTGWYDWYERFEEEDEEEDDDGLERTFEHWNLSSVRTMSKMFYLTRVDWHYEWHALPDRFRTCMRKEEIRLFFGSLLAQRGLVHQKKIPEHLVQEIRQVWLGVPPVLAPLDVSFE